jgi:DMSO/TMAO reductase YedYZ molybdopterin-dependent catalytic subunit
MPDLPVAPVRPRLDPPTGLRQIKRRPHELTRAITPAEDLFVIGHFGIPRVDVAQWSLAIDGLVGHARAFSLDEIKARPKKVVEAAHQCCGSPRKPRVPMRRVANVRWGGADLAALLDELGVDPRAQFLWSYALDGGDFAGARCEWYAKDLPRARLAAGGVLLAYELDGAPLPAEHGFPLRLVVPGYYGTNSVKWLWRLHLAAERLDGLFTTRFYADDAGATESAAGLPARRPVWATAPEAVIVAPAPGARFAADEPAEIWGWAWSFRGIAVVELSLDGGATFARAFLEPRRGWAWQRFALPWRPGASGQVTIAARALEAGGVAQPAEGARNAMHAVRVTVG